MEWVSLLSEVNAILAKEKLPILYTEYFSKQQLTLNHINIHFGDDLLNTSSRQCLKPLQEIFTKKNVCLKVIRMLYYVIRFFHEF